MTGSHQDHRKVEHLATVLSRLVPIGVLLYSLAATTFMIPSQKCTQHGRKPRRASSMPGHHRDIGGVHHKLGVELRLKSAVRFRNSWWFNLDPYPIKCSFKEEHSPSAGWWFKGKPPPETFSLGAKWWLKANPPPFPKGHFAHPQILHFHGTQKRDLCW